MRGKGREEVGPQGRGVGIVRASALVAILAAGVVSPVSGQVVVNEVMPAPGTDWTDDGVFSSSEDEWVELLNVGTASVPVDGYFLTDGTGTPRYGLTGTLAPGEHLFVTGEHAADWESVNGFPAVGLSLNNSGDSVVLFETAGGATTEVASYLWTASATEVSVGRMPDGSGTFEPFDALALGGAGAQPTPGGPNGGPAVPKILSWDVTPAFPTDQDPVRVSALAGDSDGIVSATLHWALNGVVQPNVGLERVGGTDERGTWETLLSAQAAGVVITLAIRISDGAFIAQTNDRDVQIAGSGSPIVLNEVLADPPPDLDGDANGDGTRSTSQDEFVELVNIGADPVDLTGWSIHDATGARHEFASGPVISPGDFFVVFGGGTPTGIPSGSDVASSGGLSLNNTGDEVRLVGADGVTRDFHAYGSEANADESLIRVPDGGPWTTPSGVGYDWLFSPGVSNTGPSAIEPESWARIKSLYRPGS